MDRYYLSHRKLPFIGVHGQRLLSASRVLVIGAGGLGCPCLQALAGAGIGSITIVDADNVSVENLHRQFLYDIENVGKSKAFMATERLRGYNPLIQYHAKECHVNERNILSLLVDQDIVVDCTDNFEVRFLINDACVYAGLPLVYGAIYRSEAHFSLFNYQGSATLRCLFPTADDFTVESCTDTGAYNITTAIAGYYMANEVIKAIIGDPGVMKNKLCQMDILSGSRKEISFKNDPAGRQASLSRFLGKERKQRYISAKELSDIINNGSAVALIDVRELSEREKYNIGGIHIPLRELGSGKVLPFTDTDTIVAYCETGARSREAVALLQAKGFANSFSLEGGIQNYRNYKSAF